MRSPALLALLLSGTAAQAQFAAPAATIPAGLGAVAAIDADGDGRLDLVRQSPDEGIVLHRNADGSGSLGPAEEIIGPSEAPGAWAMADLTGDGAPELVFASGTAQALLWCVNDGAGAFAAPQALLSLQGPPALSIGAIAIAELTGDGWLDLVVSAHDDDNGSRLLLAVNQAGAWGPFTAIGPSLSGDAPAFILHGDLDLLGGNDLLVADADLNAIALLNADGDGSTWLPDTLADAGMDYGLARPQLLDVDGDGDLDLAQAGFPNVFWRENDLQEDGIFGAWPVRQLESWMAAGPGAFGNLGCAAGAGFVCVPLNPGAEVRYAHWLEPLGGFAYAQELPAFPRGEALLLADFNGDGHDDLLLWADGAWQLMPSTLQPVAEPPVLPELPALCKWGDEVPLPAAQPAGGRWSGPGVVENELLRMALPGSGSFTLGYTAYGPEGCAAASAGSILVVEQPQMSPMLGGSYCRNEPPVQVTSVPPASAWVGLGADGIFNPATFTGSMVVAVYIDPTGVQCETESWPIQMQDPVPVTIAPAGPFCVNSGPQLITVVQSLIDLQWSGDIASWSSAGAVFLPGQGAGTYAIAVAANPTSPSTCTGYDTLVVVVNDQFPEVELADLPYLCAEGEPLDLAPFAEPAGGIWAGPGVAAGQFNPQAVAPGAYVITYTATLEGCASAEAGQVKVLDQAIITAPVASEPLCAYDDPVQFTAFPPGGNWGAPWSAEGLFDPGAAGPGTYPVAYAWQGPDGCVLQAEGQAVEVLPTTEVTIGAVGVLCQNGPEVVVSGNPAGTWSGAAEGEGEWVVVVPAQLPVGTHALTLTAALQGECPGTAQVNLVVEVCTGAREVESSAASVRPNPFVDGLDLFAGSQNLLTVEWLDATGRVLAAEGPVPAGARAALAPPPGGPGAYLLRLRPKEGGEQVLRVIRL